MTDTLKAAYAQILVDCDSLEAVTAFEGSLAEDAREALQTELTDARARFATEAPTALTLAEITDALNADPELMAGIRALLGAEQQTLEPTDAAGAGDAQVTDEVTEPAGEAALETADSDDSVTETADEAPVVNPLFKAACDKLAAFGIDTDGMTDEQVAAALGRLPATSTAGPQAGMADGRAVFAHSFA